MRLDVRVVLSTLALVIWAASATAQEPDVTISSTGLYVTASVGADSALIVRVVGPGGDYVLNESSADGSVSWTPSAPADGAYGYDAWVVVREPSQEKAGEMENVVVSHASGGIVVQGGRLESADAGRDSADQEVGS